MDLQLIKFRHRGSGPQKFGSTERTQGPRYGLIGTVNLQDVSDSDVLG